MSMAETPDTTPEPDGGSFQEMPGELYALGALSPAEREKLEADILAGNIDPEDIHEHLQTITELAEDIASVMPAPRRAVKDGIMAAISGTETPQEQKTIFVLADEGVWVDMAPGISIKVLFQDADKARTTLLVRLQPGAAYPPHRHIGTEECLVLEGDLHVDGTVLHAGDFTVSFNDRIHTDTHSSEGCLLLINSPMNDEFL